MQGASRDRGLKRVARLAGAGFTYNYNFGLSATHQPLCTSCGSHPLCKSWMDFRSGKTAFLCAQRRHRCHPARSRVMVHVGFGGAAGPNPLLALKQMREQFHRTYLITATRTRLPRFRRIAQCKMQLLEKPSMAHQTCFVCANDSPPDWTTARPDAARPR